MSKEIDLQRIGIIKSCFWLVVFLVLGTGRINAQDPAVSEDSSVRNALVFCGLTQSGGHHEWFGTGPNLGNCRPFCFSSDSQWFVYGNKNECYVVDANKGNVIQSSFQFSDGYKKLSRARTLAMDSDRGTLLASWHVSTIAQASDQWNDARTSRALRIHFADHDGEKLTRFRPEPKATGVDFQPFVSASFLAEEDLVLLARGDDVFELRSFDMSKSKMTIGRSRGHLNRTRIRKCGVSIDDKYFAVLGPNNEKGSQSHGKRGASQSYLRVFGLQGNGLSEVYGFNEAGVVVPEFSSLAFSPAANLLATAWINKGQGESLSIGLLDLDEGPEPKIKMVPTDNRLGPPGRKVVFVSFNHDGSRLLILSKNNKEGTSADGSARQFSMSVLQIESSDALGLREQAGTVFPELLDVAVSPASDEAAILDSNGQIKILNLNNMAGLGEFSLPSCQSLLFSPDGRRLVCACRNGRIYLLDFMNVKGQMRRNK